MGLFLMDGRPTFLRPDVAAQHQASLGDIYGDFSRCSRCHRLCTLPETLAAIRTGGDGNICPCGSRKYQLCNPPWYAIFLPRVWSFAWKRVRGRI